MAKLENWLRAKLHKRFIDRLTRRYGGTQTCPWCRQCAQSEPGWHFDSKTEPSVDVLTCGVCGGTSAWRFELGMFAIAPLFPPLPLWDGTQSDYARFDYPVLEKYPRLRAFSRPS